MIVPLEQNEWEELVAPQCETCPDCGRMLIPIKEILSKKQLKMRSCSHDIITKEDKKDGQIYSFPDKCTKCGHLYGYIHGTPHFFNEVAIFLCYGCDTVFKKVRDGGLP